jgi:c-di-GMP-related signal transduction protein
MNTSAKTATAEKPGSCLARQPIPNKDENVLGYELLFRESLEEDRFIPILRAALAASSIV